MYSHPSFNNLRGASAECYKQHHSVTERSGLMRDFMDAQISGFADRREVYEMITDRPTGDLRHAGSRCEAVT